MFKKLTVIAVLLGSVGMTGCAGMRRGGAPAMTARPLGGAAAAPRPAAAAPAARPAAGNLLAALMPRPAAPVGRPGGNTGVTGGENTGLTGTGSNGVTGNQNVPLPPVRPPGLGSTSTPEPPAEQPFRANGDGTVTMDPANPALPNTRLSIEPNSGLATGNFPARPGYTDGGYSDGGSTLLTPQEAERAVTDPNWQPPQVLNI